MKQFYIRLSHLLALLAAALSALLIMSAPLFKAGIYSDPVENYWIAIGISVFLFIVLKALNYLFLGDGSLWAETPADERALAASAAVSDAPDDDDAEAEESGGIFLPAFAVGAVVGLLVMAYQVATEGPDEFLPDIALGWNSVGEIIYFYGVTSIGMGVVFGVIASVLGAIADFFNEPSDDD